MSGSRLRHLPKAEEGAATSGDAYAPARPQPVRLPLSAYDERERVAAFVAAGGSMSNRAVARVMRTVDRSADRTAASAIRELGPTSLLDPAGSTRARRLGLDPASVHIHLGGTAAGAAASERTQAFTIGSHIAFASGAYAPETSSGRQVLDHELVHVAQSTPAVHRNGPDPPDPTGALTDADYAQLDALINNYFEMADADTAEDKLAGDSPEAFWFDLIDNPPLRAKYFRAAQVLLELRSTAKDRAQLQAGMGTAEAVAGDEAACLGKIDSTWPDKEPWAFPKTWAARVATTLQPPSDLIPSAAAAGLSASGAKLGDLAAQLPAYVLDNARPAG
jgi:hypothetical protein